MAYPDDDGTVVAPSPFGSILEPGATNIDAANKFLGEHNAAVAGRAPQIDDTLSRMQLTTDTMTKMLDDTTAAIKASREGRVNQPLLQMGAAMLAGKGNFGEQLGQGLGAASQAITRDRKEEEDVNFNLAQLALKRNALEQLPLEKKLDYMKALQVGDLAAVRSIETALIRAQAKPGAGDKAAADAAKLKQKTIQQALEEARKQVANMGTEAYATPEEREADIERRFMQNIQYQGFDINDPEIKRMQEIMQQRPGTTMKTQKSFIEDPNDPGARVQAQNEGLPPPPPTYDPSKLGIKQRQDLFKSNAAKYDKDVKDWDDASKMQSDLLNDTERAEAILKTKAGRDAVGLQHGMIGNRFVPNTSDEAQKLNGLFTKMQLHAVPKGQGAVSNMERELFEKGSPNMSVSAATNLDMLQIQKNVIARDKDRREFFTNYYNRYKTTDGAVANWERYINSPQGQAFSYKGSQIVPNMQRMPYKEYFAGDWRNAGARKDGGYIKLGREYD